MRVGIVGTGYVGLTTGVCLAAVGHEVVCVDSDPGKIAVLNRGGCPIYEPGLKDLMAEAKPRLSFTGSYDKAMNGSDVVFIAVGTPTGAGGSPDLQYVHAAATSIGERLGDDFTVVVNKSTVPIGSGNWVSSLIQEAYVRARGERPNGRFAVASNPEFLREGQAVGDSLYPDRIVVGADDPRALERLRVLYDPILNQSFETPACLRHLGLSSGPVPLVTTDLASAELIKYAANAFLATKISFINEIGQLAERVGADVGMVAQGIGLDRRIGPAFLKAGIGWGGSCFAKDTAALIATGRDYSLEMPIVSAARQVNGMQRERLVGRLLSELKILKGRTVGLLGLAFKPDTDDLRDAPAVEIAKNLVARGALVRAHDPVARERACAENPSLGWTLVRDPYEVATDADALVLVTEWKQYQELDWTRVARSMRSPLLIDGRHVFDPAAMAEAGFRYSRL